MSLVELRAEDLRCLERVELALDARSNLIWGSNGSGKTSLLEAVFLLGRGRSFRTRNSERLIRHGQPRLTVFGRTDGIPAQAVGVQVSRAGGTTARINGSTAASLTELSESFPVQVIGSLIYGPQALVGFHLPAFIAGLALHQLGPALFWGVAFGAAINRFDIRGRENLFAWGLGFGALSQLVDVGLLVPALMQRLQGADLWAQNVPSIWSWAAHLAFGITLMVFPALRRGLFPRG